MPVRVRYMMLLVKQFSSSSCGCGTDGSGDFGCIDGRREEDGKIDDGDEEITSFMMEALCINS